MSISATGSPLIVIFSRSSLPMLVAIGEVLTVRVAYVFRDALAGEPTTVFRSI
jgi:hypothetical protein